MTRVDVPTMRCDRCKTVTQDLKEMGAYQTLTHYSVSGRIAKWDMCPSCWKWFIKSMDGEE